MKINNIMTKDIVSLQAEDTVEHAAQLMKEHGVGSLPICNEGKIVGIITDRDIALRSVAMGESIQNQTVRNIMTSNPITVSPNISATEAAEIMSKKQIRRLPVVENKNLVGMVSLGDISTEPNLENSAGKALTGISETNFSEFD
ncbi:CBS domain-containing protein [Clostridium tetani]|uniref:Inosine-5-monophosphate dehydrogenase related protein n=2 Tax=Clostridium tetani TaxID=1513 RepID=Q898U3_CLOTE|nr:CBS domain-containing protein [Clostridium tetani]AAO34986.1 inosine-5-monophosphate dehydrogenase related protein [Clostridium tetani E88]AVP54883.1 CBS domain-containing protein [Clostridium tetani]KGI37372.1 CBS domain-containing protein YhcV [Clostridium tetani ATCC 9441]KGI40778.1 CBS domain-containing protein YhcV [Clostridium tetani]KGI42234.1 CBS domain-containing protein YhcV [Clostridium tetani]